MAVEIPGNALTYFSSWKCVRRGWIVVVIVVIVVEVKKKLLTQRLSVNSAQIVNIRQVREGMLVRGTMI